MSGIKGISVSKRVPQFCPEPKCQQQVTGFTGAKFKKFPSRQQADTFVRKHGSGSGLLPTAERSTRLDRGVEVGAGGAAGFRIGDREKGKKLDSGVKPLMKLEKYCIYNFHQNEDGFVYVYTDGSWEGNGTAAACAGLGVYFGEGHTLNAVSGRATNNCREFQAAALAAVAV
ncbi:ribonuclease H1 [Culex quinquefasciatus]|uniref:ribonuclease H1 n=1 Tax=Culex quinquefasciatus TaxID=7176 RepID=UPI0018E38889|nr:ribonuclease H1 [Culex quinquefasciatus]